VLNKIEGEDAFVVCGTFKRLGMTQRPARIVKAGTPMLLVCRTRNTVGRDRRLVRLGLELIVGLHVVVAR
jgi:hypothetical protein